MFFLRYLLQNKYVPQAILKYLSRLKRVGNIAHDLLFPDFCALCDAVLYTDILFCSACVTQLQPIASKKVYLTKTYFFTVHALSLYKNEFKPIIHGKYYGNRSIFRDLAIVMAQHIEQQTIDFDIIVPIPLHWTRYAWRGFNQAEIIAQVLSENSNKPIIPLLHRVKKTEYQSKLEKEARQENVKSAFEIGISVSQFAEHKNAKILLIDDVYTTGATVQEAVQVLKKHGLTSITVFVAFRGQ